MNVVSCTAFQAFSYGIVFSLSSYLTGRMVPIRTIALLSSTASLTASSASCFFQKFFNRRRLGIEDRYFIPTLGLFPRERFKCLLLGLGASAVSVSYLGGLSCAETFRLYALPMQAFVISLFKIIFLMGSLGVLGVYLGTLGHLAYESYQCL